MSYRGRAIRPGQPKPYDFVPIAQKVHRLKTYGQDRVLTQEGCFSGRLTFQVRALSPIFVSSGRYDLSEDLGFGKGEVMRGCYRISGRAAIPAASFKGVIRGVAEAVSPSCVTATRADRKKLPSGVTDTSRCEAGGDNCPTCALFGTGGRTAHIGLVRVEDTLLDASQHTATFRLSPLYRPRVSFRQVPWAYLDRQRQFKGRKFYFHGDPVEDEKGDLCEVIPPSATMTGGLSFINLNTFLLGVLGFALGLDGSFKLKLGGGKPVCLGSIDVLPQRLELDNRSALLTAERRPRTLSGEAIAGFFQEHIQAAEGEWLLDAQVTKLREILQYPGQRGCVSGLY